MLETDNADVNIHTKWMNGLIAWSLLDEIDDDDDDWLGSEVVSTTAHWYATKAWEYFRDVHLRDGMDDDNNNVRIRVGWNYGSLQAKYSKEVGTDNIYLSWYDGISMGNWIDVIAHEYTHGVIAYSSDLIYSDESGSLNESFADIFGELIEHHTYSVYGDPDWLSNPIANRSLSSPNSGGQHPTSAICVNEDGNPDTYLGTYYHSLTEFPDCNSAIVHSNSGVQNFYFYLLVTGGLGTNDNGDAYDISGIGIHDAEVLAYWTLVNVLQEGSQFADSREGWLASALLFLENVPINITK